VNDQLKISLARAPRGYLP